LAEFIIERFGANYTVTRDGKAIFLLLLLLLYSCLSPLDLR
jgi:hypothetical protein